MWNFQKQIYAFSAWLGSNGALTKSTYLYDLTNIATVMEKLLFSHIIANRKTSFAWLVTGLYYDDSKVA